jgi:hypothetical protein
MPLTVHVNFRSPFMLSGGSGILLGVMGSSMPGIFSGVQPSEIFTPF